VPRKVSATVSQSALKAERTCDSMGVQFLGLPLNRKQNMTTDEAHKLAVIISTVDYGCPFCIRDVVEQMNEAFPEFDWQTLVTAEL
jgi:hypothetical protein